MVCDPQTEWRMAHALADVVERVGAEYTMLTIPVRDIRRFNDLTPVVERALVAADCLIGLTRASGAPTYSAVVKDLYNQKSLRGMSMVMRSLDHFTGGGALADYDALYAEGQQLAAMWEPAKRIRVTSAAGTDISAPIAGEQVIVECGFATQPGQEAAFPDGEVSQMPQEGMTEGVIVVDGPLAIVGQPDSPITLQVEGGRVISVAGDCAQADQLQDIVEGIENAPNIAEFGIGLNPECRRNNDFEEEKKGRGNVHIALGDNIFYGGRMRSPVHIDMVIRDPSVWLDEQLIDDQGQIQLTDE